MSGQKKRNDKANGVSAGFLEGRVIQTRDKFNELQRQKQKQTSEQQQWDLENDDGRDLPEWSDQMLIEVANEQEATPPPTLADRSALSRVEERGKAIASSSKKISLKVIDECDREMVFSVSPSTKLRKLMMDYSRRLELDVSCFKFIFDGRRIMEDETVKQLEMEDGDTIKVVPYVSPMVTCMESQIQQKDKATTQARDHVTEHQLDMRTLIGDRDRPSLPDTNDNVDTKSSSQTKNEEMRVEHANKFRIGDPVIAWMKGFSAWPGKICMPPQDVKRPAIKQPMHCVKMFATNDFAWIEEFNIKDYEQFKHYFIRNKQNKMMSKAISEIEMYHYIKNRDTKGHPEAKKREANNNDSKASGPSSTKMARMTKTKAAAEEEPSSSELEDRDSAWSKKKDVGF